MFLGWHEALDLLDLLSRRCDLVGTFRAKILGIARLLNFGPDSWWDTIFEFIELFIIVGFIQIWDKSQGWLGLLRYLILKKRRFID